MCGRFSQHYTWEDMHRAYSLVESAPATNMEPRYNIGRFQSCDVVIAGDDGNHVHRALFELVPFWFKKPLKEKKFTSFNAKMEGLISSETKSFAPAWKQGKRCILPVSGFYEWPRPAKKGQAPFFVHAADGPLLHLAGLYSRWKDAERGEERITMAIVTCEPNALMKSIPHHRCPVTLTDAEIEPWLTGDNETAQTLLKTPGDDLMAAYRVSPYVNKIGNEGPACVAEAA